MDFSSFRAEMNSGRITLLSQAITIRPRWRSRGGSGTSAPFADAAYEKAIDFAIHPVHLAIGDGVDRREIIARAGEDLSFELARRLGSGSLRRP